MIRIYCDKNIYSSIKEGKRNFNSALKSLMDELKDIVLFTYSRAHHEDLSNSDKSFWEEDLQLLEHYVKDHYFNYDGIKKRTDCLLAMPTKSFYDIDFNILKDFFNTENNLLDTLFPKSEEEEDESVKKIKDIMQNLLDMPIPNFNLTEVTDRERERAEKYMPNDGNLTVGGMMEHFFKLGNRLLMDKKEVIELKKMMEEYVNSDKYSFEKWKDQFDIKFKENFGENSFTEMMSKVFENGNNYDDYDKFILFFNSLELYNVTRDKPLRKTQSLGSINTDANHAWYASFSDFLITDDKGLAVKAYIVYKFFKINTKIYNVEEFLNNRTIFLQQEEKKSKVFFEILKYELKNSLVLRDSVDNALNHFSILKNHHKFFNYFNRMASNQNSIKLYCQRHKNANFNMFREEELLVNKLIKLFGIDSDNKGYYSFDNEERGLDIIRKWNFEDSELIFGTAINNGGNCYCLDFSLI
ncbi:hypothetical protein HNP45_000467 [Elizabethkingia anophelis]|uniref:hypothetical protein n=2 Tax=Elizabethkingia anophelis TaxID=1117645 RepID=UPI002227FD5D|nr:hypothetical protein [Elizabethkingia anophelis]MCW2462410.1 hypothetical protein [Elizabethkingia anophelis]HBI9694026.1 hypothetical protein [Elizabethkingia anophelis]